MIADHKDSTDRPLLAAILTDVHFWVPFVVLLVGIGVLAICARS